MARQKEIHVLRVATRLTLPLFSHKIVIGMSLFNIMVAVTALGNGLFAMLTETFRSNLPPPGKKILPKSASRPNVDISKQGFRKIR